MVRLYLVIHLVILQWLRGLLWLSEGLAPQELGDHDGILGYSNPEHQVFRVAGSTRTCRTEPARTCLTRRPYIYAVHNYT